MTHKVDNKTIRRAVAALDQLEVNDPEEAHAAAESLLLDLAPDPVEEAYERAAERAEWWGYGE